jgi:hypothetical protein
MDYLEYKHAITRLAALDAPTPSLTAPFFWHR